jgi:hypothetical protein
VGKRRLCGRGRWVDGRTRGEVEGEGTQGPDVNLRQTGVLGTSSLPRYSSNNPLSVLYVFLAKPTQHVRVEDKNGLEVETNRGMPI